jgi:hypothetical protein
MEQAGVICGLADTRALFRISVLFNGEQVGRRFHQSLPKISGEAREFSSYLQRSAKKPFNFQD